MNAIDWTSYAAVYDMILAHNPAYQDLVALFEAEVSGWALPAGMPVVDVGAGTGGFSLGWARAFPRNPVVHVDLDPGMNAVAERKARAAGLGNLRIVTRGVDDASFAPGSAAAVSCVHALYTFPQPLAALARLHDWLAPGGRAFLCDIGRPLDVGDWSRFLARHLVRSAGPVGAARIFWQGREIWKQNRLIRRAQLDGTYWTHTLASFHTAVAAAGFEIERTETCFRGCSDLVVARRPLEGASAGMAEARR